LGQAKEFNTLLQLVAPPDSNRDVELIAFVRPQVKWINSAWWQWGAWDANNDFESWLETAIGACQWFNYLKQAKTSPQSRKLLFNQFTMMSSGNSLRFYQFKTLTICFSNPINHSRLRLCSCFPSIDSIVRMQTPALMTFSSVMPLPRIQTSTVPLPGY